MPPAPYQIRPWGLCAWYHGLRVWQLDFDAGRVWQLDFDAGRVWQLDFDAGRVLAYQSVLQVFV
jgi:hypothetical protein